MEDYNKITSFDINMKIDEVSTQLTFLRNYMTAFERAWNVDLSFFKSVVEDANLQIKDMSDCFKCSRWNGG